VTARLARLAAKLANRPNRSPVDIDAIVRII
jgi:hypothetical protein